jgi:hypothetical protein
MEAGDIKSALNIYKNIYFGRDGFDDWWPPVVFEHENQAYVTEVFAALIGRWCGLMDSLCEKRGMSRNR